MKNENKKSEIFNFKTFTKNELIHFLLLTENLKGKETLFDVFNELRAGSGFCKHCTNMNKKDFYKTKKGNEIK